MARQSRETTGWRLTLPCEASRPGNRLGSRKNQPGASARSATAPDTCLESNHASSAPQGTRGHH